MNTPHCIVIGAGTVGTSCAWHLVREGFQVTLVDREMPGQSTSYGNAACISPSHVVPFSHPGVWKKLPGWLKDPLGPLTVRWGHLPWVAPWLFRFWRFGTWDHVRSSAEAQKQLMDRVSGDFTQILDATGLSHYRQQRGLIVIYDTREQFERDRWEYELKEELGFAWEVVGPAELKIMAPALQLNKGMALYVPSWEHIADPGRMTAEFAQDSFQAGADWVHGEVRTVSAGSDGVKVNLSGGKTIEGDCLVVAAGAWSNHLVNQLDRKVPITAKRGYHAMIGDPGIDLDYPIMSGNRMFVMTPMAEGIRLAGTAEFARLDAEPNYDRARVLQQHASDYLPDLQCRNVTEWMGQRPMMADSIPVISPSPRHDNVYYAFGHGHYGLTQGPTTGLLIADLVQGRDSKIDMSPYRIDRFY